MIPMKTAIKFELYNLFVEGFLVYEDFNKYWNIVRFLSQRDTNVWYNALVNKVEFVRVRGFYNN